MKERIRYHWELEVYKLGFDAAMRIFEFTKAFPGEEKYSLTDQMRRASRLRRELSRTVGVREYRRGLEETTLSGCFCE